jgi:hypothetical protein
MGFNPNHHSTKAGGIKPHFFYFGLKPFSFFHAHHALKGVAIE